MDKPVAVFRKQTNKFDYFSLYINTQHKMYFMGVLKFFFL